MGGKKPTRHTFVVHRIFLGDVCVRSIEIRSFLRVSLFDARYGSNFYQREGQNRKGEKETNSDSG